MLENETVHVVFVKRKVHCFHYKLLFESTCILKAKVEMKNIILKRNKNITSVLFL